MYKKNIFNRNKNKFIDLKILTSLKSNKQTTEYAGWIGMTIQAMKFYIKLI